MAKDTPVEAPEERLPPHQFRVDGKLVTLKTTYPLKANRELVGLLRDMDPQDIASVVPVATRMIERWELDGDPAKPESYEELDVLSVLWPLHRGLNTFWAERVLGPGKPPGATSTTP